MNDTTPLLQMRGICKQYPGIQALNEAVDWPAPFSPSSTCRGQSLNIGSKPRRACGGQHR